MYHPNGQSLYPQNVPYQQSQPQQTLRPFQPQQFGPRFQTPSQQLTPPGSFYQTSPPPHHDQPRPHYHSPTNGQQFYQPPNQRMPQPSYQPPIQNFETPPNIPPPQYPSSPAPGFNQLPIPSFTAGSPIQNYNQHPPPQNFHQPPPVQNFNQTPIQNYNQPPPVQNLNQPPVQNLNQPPLVQNFNQPPPVQNFNHPPIQNFNQPPPTQNYNQPSTPYQPTSQNCHQPVAYQCPSPGFGPPPNTPYQPQVQSPESLKQPYQSSTDQCYQQQQSSFNAPRPNFNQRTPFRSPGQQRFPFKNQKPRYQQPQHGNNRFQFQPRQQYHNHRPRGPLPNFNNQSMDNGLPKKDKEQLTCDMDDCDFVGHAAAIREHQNLHHRFGLHKKVLYSNNSDAVNNWIKERKKKWPTKETIRTKLEVEDEKNKRGERIADDDFQRFNNKNNKFNNSGSNKRFNNRKRPRTNGEFIEPIEEPFNEKLKRFAGIIGAQEEENKTNDDAKPDALKLLVEYDESSDDEPPEETAIVKESAPIDTNMSPVLNGGPCSISETKDISMEHKEESCSTIEMEGVSIEHKDEVSSTSEMESVSIEIKEKVGSTSSVTVDSEAVCSETKTETCSNIKEDNERGQKRKKNSNKEFKPIKRTPPLRTPRTEVLEKKGALLEALMGDLMRKERNAITQCICYIRNNMHRFRKTQAA